MFQMRVQIENYTQAGYTDQNIRQKFILKLGQ